MEKESLSILQVLTKDNSKTFLSKVLEKRLFQMVMCSLDNIKMGSQTVKESINGKMGLIMKEISYKALEMVMVSGIKILTVFMRANLNKTVSMEKESSTTKMEVIYKVFSFRAKYQKELFTIQEDKSLNSLAKNFNHEII